MTDNKNTVAKERPPEKAVEKEKSPEKEKDATDDTKPKTTDPEYSAMRKISTILGKLDPCTAERVARYCSEKAHQRCMEARAVVPHQAGQNFWGTPVR